MSVEAESELPTIRIDFNSTTQDDRGWRVGTEAKASRPLKMEDRVLAVDADGYQCEAVVVGLVRGRSSDLGYVVYLELDLRTWVDA